MSSSRLKILASSLAVGVAAIVLALALAPDAAAVGSKGPVALRGNPRFLSQVGGSGPVTPDAGAGDAIADAGFVDVGSCPPDCGLLTDEYAAQFEADGYMVGLHQIIENLTNKAHVSFVVVHRQPGLTGVEEILSEYEPVYKSGIFWNHSSTERHLAGAPHTDSGVTPRANTADAGTVPTDPMIEFLVVNMAQASNATKMSFRWYVDGGTKTLGKYSVGSTMLGTIQGSRDASFGVGGRASLDGGGTIRFSGTTSELIVVDGLLSDDEMAAFVHYSADAGQRVNHPRGHTRWSSFMHWWRFGDGDGDNWYDGGTIVEDQIGANDLTVYGPIERTAWTN